MRADRESASQTSIDHRTLQAVAETPDTDAPRVSPSNVNCDESA
jgi:hypothetical protein